MPEEHVESRRGGKFIAKRLSRKATSDGHVKLENTSHEARWLGASKRAMNNTPNEAYSITLRMRLKKQPGMLGSVSAAIGAAGGIIGGVDIVEATPRHTVPRFTLSPHPLGPAEQNSTTARRRPD